MSATLIMFDGPDGVGKTTQITLARDALTQQGLRVYPTRINGGSPIGEALREPYLSNIERPAATDYHIGMAIYAAFVEEVGKMRQQYDVILVDRSPLSNVAYQSFGSGYSLDKSLAGCEETLQALQPDLLICYMAPLATLHARLSQVAGSKTDYFESKPDNFFERVLEGYQFLAERFQVTVIDATQDVDAVHKMTLALLQKTLEAA
jgi:dTMP kinase